MKDKIKLTLPLVTLKILNSLCILFSAFILISTLRALYFLTADPPDLPCLMCEGCPCPPSDFVIARNYYLNFLFPTLIFSNIILIALCIILISILKFKYSFLKLTLFIKKYGKSEDLFKAYKSTIQSNDFNLKYR
ncbi:MAG: hypothetical protein ACFFAK_18170 [Promethearchaeota archaeon]